MRKCQKTELCQTMIPTSKRVCPEHRIHKPDSLTQYGVQKFLIVLDMLYLKILEENGRNAVAEEQRASTLLAVDIKKHEHLEAIAKDEKVVVGEIGGEKIYKAT